MGALYDEHVFCVKVKKRGKDGVTGRGVWICGDNYYIISMSEGTNA